jgi:sec-independent protein translocase protein TatB
MFDIGWSEMLVIGVIAVLVIGPKDIPKIMYQVGRFARRLQYMKFAMSQQFDDVLKAGDIEELRRGVNFEAPKTDEAAADEELPEPVPPEQILPEPKA